MTATEIKSKSVSIAFKIQELNQESGVFIGILSAYNVLDWGGEIVKKGAFTKTIKESGGKIPLYLNHDLSDVRQKIGLLELADQEDGLYVKGTLNLEMPSAQQALSVMRFDNKNGLKTGLSIGFLTIKDSVKDGTRYLEEVKLLEGSIVTIPANPNCFVLGVKRAPDGITEMKGFSQEFEMIRVFDLKSQALNALYYGLSDDVYGAGTREEALTSVKQSIADFSAVIEEFVNGFFDIQGKSDVTAETKDAFKARISEFKLQVPKAVAANIAALLEKGKALLDGAAIQPDEPGDTHSDELTDEEKTAVSDFLKGVFDDKPTT